MCVKGVTRSLSTHVNLDSIAVCTVETGCMFALTQTVPENTSGHKTFCTMLKYICRRHSVHVQYASTVHMKEGGSDGM